METDEIIIKFGHIFTTVSRSILNNYTSIGHVAEKYEIWIANFKLDAQTGHLLQHKQNVYQNQYQLLLHAQTGLSAKNTGRMSTRTSINFCYMLRRAICCNTSRMSTRTSINFCYMLRRVICCNTSRMSIGTNSNTNSSGSRFNGYDLGFYLYC